MANNYFNFTQPVVAGTRIVSARYNQDLSSIAAAFDVLPGSDDLFLSLLGYGLATGSTPNVYNVTIPVGAPLVSYVTGMQVTFLADKTSTGAAQLNVNGLGNKLIVSSGSIGLPAGSIIAGSYYTLRYDGVNFQMQTALYALFDMAAQSAAASAAAALVSQNAAAGSATNAANSASAAAGSKAAAAISETNAATYASQALGYRNTAQTAATTATTQATNAGNSATAAATSESNALAYRNAAQTAATNASGSATAAATSATNAANSATAAANSAASIQLPLPVSSGGTGATTQSGARTGLGLGNSATLDVGSSAGTVAAGNDARMVGALQKSGGAMTGDIAMGNNSLSGVAQVSFASVTAARATANNMGFGQAGGNRAQMPIATGAVLWIAQSVTVTTNGSGLFTISFPQTFATTFSAVAVSGDFDAFSGVIALRDLSSSGFNGKCTRPDGTPHASSVTRINYFAMGVIA